MRRTLVALALLAAVPPAAEGAFAGSNGKVAYAGKLGGSSALIVREGNNVRAAVDGTRNNTLFRAAFNLGQLVGAGLIGRGGVESELIDAALSVGLGEREVLRTLKSGMDAGIEKPRR